VCVNANKFSLIVIGPSRVGSHSGWMDPG
jgi:hypothetical protein